jgi:hypothetical protein
MRSRVLGLCAAALLSVGAATPALAGPPARLEEPIPITFPDTNLGLVVFINIDRETYCTPEIIAFEEALIAWLEGGEVGDPPEFPGEPEGFDTISIKSKETWQGAIVQQFKGSGLSIELWEMDADPPLVGPCTDTDDAMNLIASGTARFMSNDNDLFGSGTRGNAFGNRINAQLEDDEGNAYRYSSRFHFASRCHAPDDAPPACLIDRSRLQQR